MNGTVQLVAGRKATHGDWVTQANCASTLKRDMRAGAGWHALPPHQQEALDMIATKLSRILTGNSAHADHWDDLAGYALLGKSGHPDAERGQ